ncbi:MAG: OsmC family protein [Cyclobacteriaceae bacterium]|nr:OsmC family protein [Cyclobacteriaceae bacterium]
MKIITRYLEDELYIAENENGNTIHIDMRNAEDKKSLAPVEMMLASIAGCAAIDIVSMLKKKRKTFVDLTIETTGVRRDEHPRGLTHITSKYILVSPDTNLETFEKVAKLATDKYCSAAASVKAKIEVVCEVVQSK